MKIKRQLSQRAMKRFKSMCFAALILTVINYVSDQAMQDVFESNFLVRSQDENVDTPPAEDGNNDPVVNEDGQGANPDSGNNGGQSGDQKETLQEKAKKLGIVDVQTGTYAKFSQEDLEGLKKTKKKDGTLKYTFDDKGMPVLTDEQKVSNDFADYFVNTGTADAPVYAYQPDALFDWEPNDVQGVGKKSYFRKQVITSSNGFVEEWHNKDDDYCYSYVLIPGTSLLPKPLLGVTYFIFLCFLFLGISIIADMFMEAIETITSKVQLVEKLDEKTQMKYQVEEPVWNATFANLTLMALGSSAPEILLSVIETVSTLGEPAGPLGASTIVGSAAFNLLVISGVSIIAVDEPKKIYDLLVFGTTSIFSIFAYVWLYLCLTTISPQEVDLTEAWLTLIFFFVLVILAFIADRVNHKIQEKNKSAQQKEAEELENKLQQQKLKLKSFANKKGAEYVVAVADGSRQADNEAEGREIKDLYKDILKKDNLAGVSVAELNQVLQPSTLLERFAARKSNQVGATKDFVAIKGQKGQLENDLSGGVKNPNELIGFKCLHYSVTESSGTIDITVVKRVQNQEISFGIRTKDDTAKNGQEYEQIDEIITLKKRDPEFVQKIVIYDNNDWQPDLDFYVELYDPNSAGKTRFSGDDTQTKVTILDEDFPGTLGFAQTDLVVSKFQQEVYVSVKRSEGSDGKINCLIRTEPMSDDQKGVTNNAQEYEDYIPLHETIEFASGENEKTVKIELVIDKYKGGKTNNDNKIDPDDIADEDEEEIDQGEDAQDVMFKVKIEKPQPTEVKISKKNVCLVTIVQNEDVKKEQDEHAKMVQYFMAAQNPGWLTQFRTAVELGPQIDDENMILDDVTLYEAIVHFMCIGWKCVFAFVPPPHMGGGIPAFVIALVFIGIITAIVAEVATILGCVINLKGAVTAITLVAMGTSLPDTFASMTAARTSEYADSAVGNVTGSNCVNVFLGLGLPWVISAHYNNSALNRNYPVPAGDLGFSVMLFLITSITCFIILIGRRIFIGGELGGATTTKYISCALLVGLWLIYVIFSSLNAYGVLG